MATVLLLHGFPLDGTMWAPQVRALEAAGHRVLTPTLEVLPAGNRTLDAWAGQIRDLIVREAGGRAVVGGLSMGGYLLMALLRAHPSCVGAAIFLDTRAEADGAEGRAGRLKMIEQVQAHGTEGVIEPLLGRMLNKSASEEVREQLRTIMRQQAVERVVSAQAAMAQRRDQTDLFPTLKMPTLFICGSADALTPPAMMRGLAAKTAGARFVEIAGAGHMSNLENAGAVNAALLEFLQGL